jgi:hypothetical protein
MDRKELGLLAAVAIGAGFLGGVFSNWLTADAPALAQQRMKVVNSEEFLLVDKFGRTRGGFGLDQNGEVGLVLLGKDGSRSLHLTPDEPQAVKLKDKTGKTLWAVP